MDEHGQNKGTISQVAATLERLEPGSEHTASPRRIWHMMLPWLALVLLSCGGTTSGELDPGSAKDGPSTRASDATTTTTERRTTTTARTTTTDQETGVADLICDATEEYLDENPQASVAEAISFATAWREELVEKGYDPSVVGQKISRSCINGYNNEIVMGYGGWGPLADAVSYTLDRGTCSSRGDYGGVLTMAGSGGNFSVELSLTYTAANIIEHQGTEYVDIEAGGNDVAFEFFMPQLPSGGICEVELVSVRPI